MSEKERWQFVIFSLLASALVLFLLVLVLNAGTLLVGAVLTIFHVAISVVVIVGSVFILLWVLAQILETIGDAEARISRDLESLRKTLLRATHKFGADFLAVVTGLLAYLIQEAVANYPEQYKVAICVLFTLNFFLASQLIGSEKRSDKALGVFFFVSPVLLFAISALSLVTPQVVVSWLKLRPLSEIILMSFVLLSILLTFVFAFFKQREE